MNILVTGARGMVGSALVANLKNIRDGKNRTRPGIQIEEIYEYRVWPEQEGRGGAVLCLWGGNRGKGGGLSLPQPDGAQPAQVQQRHFYVLLGGGQ